VSPRQAQESIPANAWREDHSGKEDNNDSKAISRLLLVCQGFHAVCIDMCYHFRVQMCMGRWKRFGVIVVQYSTDHDPPHVHVFEDGKRILKFNIEAWTLMEGNMTTRARRALNALRNEGVFGEKS
jgi:hypothetical protein